ncbi:MAG: flagellar basal body rod protein FlgC [Pseudomonadota bacterium]
MFNIFDISGSSMAAQSVRMNVTASNIANSESMGRTPDAAYHARSPIFQTVLDQNSSSGIGGVRVMGVVENQQPGPRRFEPGNPMADGEGYVYLSNVDVLTEMVNMMSASRTYQNSIEVLNTSKELMIRTLSIGQ